MTALRPNGDTAWSRAYPYTPARLDARVVDSVREGLQRTLHTSFPREVITRALYVPTYRAPVTEALAGDDGTLWLRWESATSSDLYSVLGVDGRIVAHVHASSRVRLRWVFGTTAWGEERDEDNVPTLVRYRVTSAK